MDAPWIYVPEGTHTRCSVIQYPSSSQWLQEQLGVPSINNTLMIASLKLMVKGDTIDDLVSIYLRFSNLYYGLSQEDRSVRVMCSLDKELKERYIKKHPKDKAFTSNMPDGYDRFVLKVMPLSYLNRESYHDTSLYFDCIQAEFLLPGAMPKEEFDKNLTKWLPTMRKHLNYLINNDSQFPKYHVPVSSLRIAKTYLTHGRTVVFVVEKKAAQQLKVVKTT